MRIGFLFVLFSINSEELCDLKAVDVTAGVVVVKYHVLALSLTYTVPGCAEYFHSGQTLFSCHTGLIKENLEATPREDAKLGHATPLPPVPIQRSRNAASRLLLTVGVKWVC